MTNDAVLHNDWHPVSWSQDIKDDTVKPIHLLGEDLVLWRSHDQIVACLDLCPHRGARLSLGQVENHLLVCPYHGLAFDFKGQCVQIPAHPDLLPPTRACVQSYTTQERYGLVWVCLGNPTQDIPTFWAWDEPSFHSVCCGPYHVKSSGFRVIENFLDVAHFPFVHAKVLGDHVNPVVKDFEVDVEANGITLRNVRVWQPDPDPTGQEGLVTYNYHVLRPLTTYFTKDTPSGCLSIFFTITPVTEEECMAWMWVAMNYASEIPDAEHQAFQDQIVSQDLVIVESQRPKRLPLDLQAEYHLPCDRGAIAYRKWLKQLGVTFGTT